MGTSEAPADAATPEAPPGPRAEPARSGGRWWLVVLIIAVLAFGAAIAVQRNAFPFYSGDHDEPVLRYQAEMLREGVVTIPRAQAEFFRPWLTGPHGDRLVPAFQPLWPAVLAVSDAATGSMLPALGLAAALLVVAGFLLARELLGGASRAVLATAVLAASPFVLLLSGTYLSYVFALALGTGLAVAVLRGLRTGSRALFATAGGLLGLLLLTRPYDAVLYALPLAAYALLTRRHRPRELLAPSGWFLAALVPLLAVTMAYNLAVSGSATTFATSVQSQGTSAFFYGTRSIAHDTPILDFTPSFAFSSFGQNLWAVPTWLFGTYLTLAAAVYGAVLFWRQDRARFWLLVAMTFAFPVGYLVWWASALTEGGALDGLGPHYYLPMYVPLAILATHGALNAFAHARARRRALVVGGVVAAVALTAIALPPKIEDKRLAADGARKDVADIRHGLARAPGRTLVIQERRGSPYVMEPYPYLANDPALENDRLYALDRGAKDIDLLAQHPDRRAFRIVHQLKPGTKLDRLPIVLERQSVVRGPTVELHTRITNAGGKARVTAYLRWGAHREARLLDTASHRGVTYDVTWTLTPDGIHYAGPAAARVAYPHGASRAAKRLEGTTAPPAYDLQVGALYAASRRVEDPDRSERDYYGRVRSGQVELLSAGEQWTRLGPPFHAWLPITVDSTLTVRMVPGPARD